MLALRIAQGRNPAPPHFRCHTFTHHRAYLQRSLLVDFRFKVLLALKISFKYGFALIVLPFHPRKAWRFRGSVPLIEEYLPMVGMYPVTAVAMMKKKQKIEQTFRDTLSSGQS